MKFGAHLLASAVPEWSTRYLSYKVLKKAVKHIAKKRAQIDAEREKHAAEVAEALADAAAHGADAAMADLYPAAPTPPSVLRARARQLAQDPNADDMPFDQLVPPGIDAEQEERAFFAMLQAELDKINKFYLATELAYQRQASSLATQITRLQVKAARRRMGRLEKREHDVTSKKLRTACEELYRGLDFLKEYRLLNYTAFVKILKKHDKRARQPATAALPVMARVLKAPFFTSPIASTLCTNLESAYMRVYTGGDLRKAIRQLRPPDDDNSGSCVSYFVGMAGGLSTCLAMVFLALYMRTDLTETVAFQSSFPVFRGTAVILVHTMGWSIVVWACQQTRINYAFILDLHPRNHLSPTQILHTVTTVTVAYMASLGLTSSAATSENVAALISRPEFVHFCFFVGTLTIMVWPFDMFFRSSRVYLWTTWWRIFRAPFVPVMFKDFFVGNHLTSLSKPLLDIAYAFCFYFSGAFLTYEWEDCRETVDSLHWFLSPLPSWYRFLQCLRRYRDTPSPARRAHAINAGKYFSSICASVASQASQTYPSDYTVALWVLCAIISTTYNFTWDVKCDWGLLQRGSRNRFLRNNLIMPQHKWVYFVGMFCNLCLRVAWIVSISPAQFGVRWSKDYLAFLLACLETFRRNIWSFFRLENEHLNNCGQFRAVKEVPVLVKEEPAAIKVKDAWVPKAVHTDDDTDDHDKPKSPRSRAGTIQMADIDEHGEHKNQIPTSSSSGNLSAQGITGSPLPLRLTSLKLQRTLSPSSAQLAILHAAAAAATNNNNNNPSSVPSASSVTSSTPSSTTDTTTSAATVGHHRAHPPTVRPPWLRRTLSLVNLVTEEHQKIEDEAVHHEEALDVIGMGLQLTKNDSKVGSPKRGVVTSDMEADNARQAELRRSAALMKSISLMPGYVSELQIEGLEHDDDITDGDGDGSHDDPRIVPSVHRHGDGEYGRQRDVDDHDEPRRHRRHASMYRGADDDDGSDVESGDDEERKAYESFPV